MRIVALTLYRRAVTCAISRMVALEIPSLVLRAVAEAARLHLDRLHVLLVIAVISDELRATVRAIGTEHAMTLRVIVELEPVGYPLCRSHLQQALHDERARIDGHVPDCRDRR